MGVEINMDTNATTGKVSGGIGRGGAVAMVDAGVVGRGGVGVTDKYAYRVMWSEEDREFVGLCAEFPSLSWLDETPEAALSGIRGVVADCVADMAGNGESAPEPIATRRYSGKFMARVPPDTHRRLALQAAEAGVSLNRVVAAKLAR